MWIKYEKSFAEFQKEFFLELRGMEIEFLDDKNRKTVYLIGDVSNEGSVGFYPYDSVRKDTIILNYREWNPNQKVK